MWKLLKAGGPVAVSPGAWPGSSLSLEAPGSAGRLSCLHGCRWSGHTGFHTPWETHRLS